MKFSDFLSFMRIELILFSLFASSYELFYNNSDSLLTKILLGVAIGNTFTEMIWRQAKYS